MKKLQNRKTSALGALAVLLMIGGCAGTPTRYYTLADPAPVGGMPQQSAALAIEMAPVAVPERLARPQMVVRAAKAPEAEVEVLEQSRWSSSFESELRDALGAGIAQRLSAFDATRAGRSRSLPVYRIAVQVRRFDAQTGNRVDGAFGWSVRRGDEDALISCQLQLSEPASGGIDAIAQGAQRMTTRLADAIALNVGALAANQPARCPA